MCKNKFVEIKYIFLLLFISIESKTRLFADFCVCYRDIKGTGNLAKLSRIETDWVSGLENGVRRTSMSNVTCCHLHGKGPK